MKKFIFAALALACLSLTGCGYTKVPAGNVGVKVYLLGGEKGVDNEVLGPGRYFIGFNEDLFLFPIFTQNYTWIKAPTCSKDPEDKACADDESITFQTREGLSVNADVGISYSIRADKVALIFQKYRKGIDEITDLYLRNMVRDALAEASSVLPVETVYGEGKSDLMNAVEKTVREQVDPIGITIEKIYWVGEVRVPDVVKAAINAKIEATQRAQQRENEVAEARAEANKKIEEARGSAESQLLIAKTKAQGVELQGLAEAKSIEARGRALSGNPSVITLTQVEKWDGILPKQMIPGGTVPFLDLGTQE